MEREGGVENGRTGVEAITKTTDTMENTVESPGFTIKPHSSEEDNTKDTYSSATTKS